MLQVHSNRTVLCPPCEDLPPREWHWFYVCMHMTVAQAGLLRHRPSKALKVAVCFAVRSSPALG